MRTNMKLFVFNAFINLINVVIKFSAGVLFSFSPSIADSIYSLSDFITDLLDMIGFKISNKKPTSQHPFGFGRIEYIINLFVGIMLLVIGIGLLLHSFHLEKNKINLSILLFVLASIVLKGISILKLMKAFKKTKNKTIYMNVVEAKLDIFSSVIIFFVVIISQFSDTFPILNKSSIIGSIVISCLIIKSGIELLKDNVLTLLGAIDNNEEYIKFIKGEIEKFDIKVSKIELIRYGSYYKAHLILNLSPNTTIATAKKIQNKVVKELKRMRKLKIKFVNIDLDVSQN